MGTGTHSHTSADLYAVENKIVDGIDAPGRRLVRFALVKEITRINQSWWWLWIRHADNAGAMSQVWAGGGACAKRWRVFYR